MNTHRTGPLKAKTVFFLAALSLCFIFIQCQQQPAKSIIVENAGIACAEPQAAAAGLQILQQDGNAIDALITVAFAMAVTYPRAGNLGGGGFLLYRSAEGAMEALDFRETAPSAATFDMYWDDRGNPLPEKSLLGALAVGIPGTVRGLHHAHKKYGKLPWEYLLQPAIQLARKGFPIGIELSESLENQEDNFKQFPESYRIFFPEGRPPEAGETLRQQDLAHTLQLIAEQGDQVFYTGEIADKIVASVQKHGGIFTKEDMTGYLALERQPVEIAYGGHILYSIPPPSSGGLVMQGILNTLQQIDFPETYPHNSADYIAYLSEVEKQWYALRNIHLGDPGFVEIPYGLFSSPESAGRIANLVSTARPQPAREMPEFARALSLQKEETETTHISILDEAGNAVSMTYTLNGSFGSYLVAGGPGILLNNEMDDFAAKPGHPNLYGLIQGWANAVEPGKRMLSSMSPTIVEKQGELVGILGTPGGSTIITSVLQVTLNKIDYHMTLNEAMAAGRFHHQWLPDSIYYEKGNFPAKTLDNLRAREFKFLEVKHLADIQAIWKLDDKWEVCSDPRGTGVPVGY